MLLVMMLGVFQEYFEMLKSMLFLLSNTLSNLDVTNAFRSEVSNLLNIFLGSVNIVLLHNGALQLIFTGAATSEWESSTAQMFLATWSLMHSLTQSFDCVLYFLTYYFVLGCDKVHVFTHTYPHKPYEKG